MPKELAIRLTSTLAWMIAVLLFALPTLRAQQPTVPVQSGFVAWSATTCPTGWSEYLAARGRAIVGLPSGGTLEGTAGTALGAEENRVTGQHTHTTTETTHAHSVTDPGHAHGGNADFINLGSGDPIASRFAISSFGGTLSAATTSITVNAAAASVTIQTAGSVGNTNAPYIELRACKKN